MIRGQRVADRHAGVEANHGEASMAERLHERDHVIRLRARVVAALGFVGQADPALIDRDDLEVTRQRRHHQPPLVPGLRPAMDQQEWTALASDDGVKAHAIRVDVAARERVRETRRQIRCSEDGAWAGGDASG